MNLRWARTLTLTVVAISILCITHFRRGDAQSPHVLRAVLLHPCSSVELSQRGDSRDIWLRYLAKQQAYINEEPTASIATPAQVERLTSRRLEEVVWLAADPRLSYGEVASYISNLAHLTPGLVVLLSTSSETGPIDPIEMNRLHVPPRMFLLCPPKTISRDSAVLATD